MSIKNFLQLAAAVVLGVECVFAQQPAPYGPLPSKQQVDWLRMEW